MLQHWKKCDFQRTISLRVYLFPVLYSRNHSGWLEILRRKRKNRFFYLEFIENVWIRGINKMRISACDFNYIVTFAVGEMLDGKLNVERSDTRGIYQPTRKLVVKVAIHFHFDTYCTNICHAD